MQKADPNRTVIFTDLRKASDNVYYSKQSTANDHEIIEKDGRLGVVLLLREASGAPPIKSSIAATVAGRLFIVISISFLFNMILILKNVI